RADAQPRALAPRQVHAVNQQIDPPIRPADGRMANLVHRRVPVGEHHRRHLPPGHLAGLGDASVIARDARLKPDQGVVDRLDHAFGAVLPGDAEKPPRHDQSVFAIAPAVSTMRFEKPHSLSYQLSTRTSLPSSTAVSRLSIVDDTGAPLKS